MDTKFDTLRLKRAPRRKPLKITHVITRFIRGGADENTLLTCNGQARLGHDVCLIYGAESHPEMLGQLDSAVRKIELKSLRRELHPYHDARCLLELATILRQQKCDLVHTHESKAGVVGRLAARVAGVPLIVHGVHILAHLNSGRLKGAIYKAADWCAAQMTDLFIDVSDGMRSACLQSGFGKPDQHVVIESGMDVLSYQRARRPKSNDALLQEIEVQEPTWILVAGALEPRKRVLEFLDVFALVAEQAPNACLLIAGDGPLRQELTARIKKLKLDGRVICLGHRANLGEWIAMADLCVHASEREGLPRVVVQYVARGKPVVVSDLPGVERVVHHEVNGYIVGGSDPQKMREYIIRLIASRELRHRMGAAARKVDVSAWSASEMVTRVEAAYDLALRRAHRGA